jgi:predicted enzyme related to lactoylglutathione lyase
MSDAPSYFEIGVPDGAKARIFYSRIFPHWTFHPMGEGDQAWIETAGLRGGLHDHDAESRIELFFAVDDIETAVRSVREAGGHADEPSPVEAGFGRFAACRDDQDVWFGLHEPR